MSVVFRRTLLSRPLGGLLLQTAPMPTTLGRLVTGPQLAGIPMRNLATKSEGKAPAASRGRFRSPGRKAAGTSKSASPKRSRSASSGRASRKSAKGARSRSVSAEKKAAQAEAKRERKKASRERRLAKEEEKKEAKRERLAERRARRHEKEAEAKEQRAIRRAEKVARNQEKRAIAKEKERIRRAKEKERAKGRRREPGSPPMPRNPQALYVQANFHSAPGATAPERMKHLSAQFKSLSADDKKQWESKAAADKQRYQKEFAEWRAVNPERPKRPLSSYLLFANENRASFAAGAPKGKEGVIAIGKALGAKWRGLSAAEKAKYNQASAAASEKYKVAVEEWQRKAGTA